MWQIYYMRDGKKVPYMFGSYLGFKTEKEARERFNAMTKSNRRKSFIEFVPKEN